MKNIEKYHDAIKQKLQKSNTENLGCAVFDIRTGSGYCGDCDCKECCIKSFEWLNQEYKDPIIDDVEREYLSAVIKPFRKNISCIRKSKDPRKGKNYIKIEFCDGDCMFFPNLSNNAMYKGMKLDRNYTLEELGL